MYFEFGFFNFKKYEYIIGRYTEQQIYITSYRNNYKNNLILET